jgi:hypothetical protein
VDFPALDGMSIEDMQAEFVELADQLSAISLRRQQLLQRMTKLRADATAKVGVARLSDNEKAALRAALNEGSP